METVFTEIWRGLLGTPWLDLTNLILGIIGVTLMIRRNLWAFPVGLVAVSVQAVVFWQTKFYADALLQGFFFVLLLYGWWHWTHPRENIPELPVTRQPWRWRLVTVGITVVAWLAISQLSATMTDSLMPYRDAFIAAFSVTGQLLQARKKVENWPVWVAVNTVAVWSYAAAGIHYTAFLYAVYLVLGLIGWRAWSKVRT